MKCECNKEMKLIDTYVSWCFSSEDEPIEVQVNKYKCECDKTHTEYIEE